MNVRKVTDRDANTACNTQDIIIKNQEDLIPSLKKQINLLKTNSPGRRDEKIGTQKRLTKSDQTTSSKQRQLYSVLVQPQQSRQITNNFEHMMHLRCIKIILQPQIISLINKLK
ncbi:hypothetical protein FQA39_LY18719 [Lamprigera yunnana]|nr:hypothetical protein FQA39_LY18719 [Lamprigera yunnana]